MSDSDLESVPDDGARLGADTDLDDDGNTDTWLLPGRGRRIGGRLPGSPERRSWALPVLVVLALRCGGAAGIVARGYIPPAQVAASANAPKAEHNKQRVKFGV